MVVEDADAADAVEPVRRCLVDCAARGNRPASVRSYAYDLLRHLF
jgi:integrase/recombinase XerD